MSEPEPYSTNDDARERLVAYLDGELDAETSWEVERRLAEDAAYRHELQQLQRAWDMLDGLPRADVGESFTQTTVEAVALSAAQELSDLQTRHGRGARVARGVACAGLAIAALASYLVVSAYLARPNAELLRDLPVIENLDLYEVVDSGEFPRQLVEHGLFTDEADVESDAEPTVAQGYQPSSAERLEQMSDAEKAAVVQNKRRFDALPLEQQARMRQIHDALSQDPRQAELRRVLERYHEWLRTLTPAARAELLSLPTGQRAEQITELTRAEEAKRVRMMAGGFMMRPQDLAIIHDWFDTFIDDHASEILAALPDEPFARLKKEYDPARDRQLLRFHYVYRNAANLPRPSQDDEARLQSLVSKPARQALAEAADDAERSRIVLRWVGAAVLSRLRNDPSLDELEAFAQHSLSDQERVRLESLPRDRWYRELRALYRQHRLAEQRKRGPEGAASPPVPADGPPLPPWWRFP